MTARAFHSDLTLYRRLLREARPYWLHMAGLFLVSLLATPLALLTPLPLKIAVESVVESRPLPRFLGALQPVPADGFAAPVLIFAAGLLVAIALLTQLQQLATSTLRAYVGERMVVAFRSRLFRHAHRLSLAYHDSRGTGDSIYRIQYDAPTIQYITIDTIIPFITACSTVLGMIYVTAALDWQLALVGLAISPLLFLILQLYRARLRKQWGEVEELETSAFSVVQEVLVALRAVKAFAQEEREDDRFIRRSGESARARVRFAVVEGAVKLLIGLATAIGTAVALYVGMRQVQSGALTLGELLLVMGYLVQLYEPLRAISGMTANLQSLLVRAERAFVLLDEPPDVAERPDARPIVRAAGAIAFRSVSFAYDARDPVVDDISFEIAPGTRLGISGATGAGKTTLVSLLVRFYDPTEGQILLDGVDLRDYKLADLRKQFAIVLQEPVLFSTTIAENIAYGRPEANQQEIVEAARAANGHDFIMALPERYHTLVGERGMRLSGGERQRVSLARAFLKDAPILVLDEPTSSVDERTEAAIMEAMERLMRSRTTIMIAHRLSTLASCDMRLEIDGGRVGELALVTSKVPTTGR